MQVQKDRMPPCKRTGLWILYDVSYWIDLFPAASTQLSDTDIMADMYIYAVQEYASDVADHMR